MIIISDSFLHLLTKILIPPTFFFLIISCSSNMNDQEKTKFDPALKDKINKLSSDQMNETISVLIKSEKEISPELRAEIENSGIIIESVIGNIITARGTAEQLSESALLPYLIKFELSHNRPLN